MPSPILARLAAAAVALAISMSDPAAAADLSCEREMARAARRHAVPLGVLYAVALNESGRNGRLNPYALNVAGRSIHAASLAEALGHFDAARARGIRLIDVGCMQVNHHWHGTRFTSVTAMFDPAGNVDYAARFLKSLHAREASWSLAVARYHAGGRNDPAKRRYICGVIAKLVASGFGRWTDAARGFCNR